jgi:hypothetical protein
MSMKMLLSIGLSALMLTACANHDGGTMKAATESVPANSLRPRTDWRVDAQKIAASSNGESLRVLREGKSATWETTLKRNAGFAVQIPDGQSNPVMITYETGERENPFTVICETSTNTTVGSDGSWTRLDETQPGMFLEKFIVDPAQSKWVRLRIEPKNPSPENTTIKLSNIALYDIDPNGRNDYWVVLGASIQFQSIRQSIFHEMVTERWPDADPVIFNEAIGGWTTKSLVNKLPGFLEEHPYASYMPIHIGGNNVSGSRPYPGGADVLQADLETILTMIRDNGKTPILSRLSYRAYQAKGDKPAVPPEEYGSGPYVTNIFDPMIAQYCPQFYNEAEGRGMVDAYNWFKEHQDELSADGIHVNDAGKISWNRLWAENAGKVIYE